MKKEFIISMPICLMLMLFVMDSSLHDSKSKFLRAQLIQGNTNVSRQQRLGTASILGPPDDVSLISTNHKNSTLDEEFVITGTADRHNIAISNPNYGLSAPIMTFMPGEKFNVNSSTDSEIVYTTATVKLVPITSPFPPNNMRVEVIDPEKDLSLGTPITIENYTGSTGTFVIPHIASQGSYLLYVYFYYPHYNITLVYNTAVQVKGSGTGTGR